MEGRKKRREGGRKRKREGRREGGRKNNENRKEVEASWCFNIS